MIEPKGLGRGELLALRVAYAGNADFEKLIGHIEAMEQEEHFLHKLTSRQGKLLTGVVNAIRGEPEELTLWSHHDAPQLAARAMELLRLLTFAGRIAGGTAGRDENLCVALDAAQAFLPPVKALTDRGVALPGWEEVSRKAERGEALNPIEAFVMRLTPGDNARAEDFRRMLRAALDYTVTQPKTDER